MMYWIRKGTRLFSGSIFFLVLISVVVRFGNVGFTALMTGFLYAIFAATLGWFLGFIVFDIMIKGVILNLENIGIDTIIEGGIIQRVRMMQHEFVPGGTQMPFENSSPRENRSDATK